MVCLKVVINRNYCFRYWSWRRFDLEYFVELLRTLVSAL